MATELLTSISRDERERALFRSRRIAQLDMEHNYAVVRKEKAIEVAKNALREGLPIPLISTLTGLKSAEIEALKQ